MTADELFHLYQPVPLSDADIDRMFDEHGRDEEEREVPAMVRCRACYGSGRQHHSHGYSYPCEDCGGEGYVPAPNPHDD